MERSVHGNLIGGKTLIESIFFYIAFRFWVVKPRSPIGSALLYGSKNEPMDDRFLR